MRGSGRSAAWCGGAADLPNLIQMPAFGPALLHSGHEEPFEKLVLSDRRVFESLAPVAREVLVVERLAELALRQVKPSAAHPVVEVPLAFDQRLQDFTAQQILCDERRNAALTAGGVVGSPFSASIDGPRQHELFAQLAFGRSLNHVGSVERKAGRLPSFRVRALSRGISLSVSIRNPRANRSATKHAISACVSRSNNK